MSQRLGNFQRVDFSGVHGALAYQASPPPKSHKPPNRLFHAAAFLLFCATGCAAGSVSHCDVGLDLTAIQCAAVKNLQLPADVPAARGNTFGDSQDAAVLGFQIFFDARFSANSEVRCATCHTPEDHFSDGRALAQGMGPVDRNAINLLNSAWNRWMFWDGRADTLWSQPLVPLEAANEMGFSRLALAHALQTDYRQPYEALFGPLPALDDTKRFPLQGKPGDAAFDGMAPADQQAINLVAANVGKSLEAYLRHVAAGASPLEQFLAGNRGALTPAQQHGLQVFAQAGCIACHGGANLTDDGFHNIGVPAWPGSDADPGRASGLQILNASAFNSQGPFFDGSSGRQDDSGAAASNELGAFKTPSLRNLAFSSPYGHNGIFATLDAVVDFHLQGGGSDNSGYLGTIDPLLQPTPLTPGERADLLNFLQVLVGAFRGDYNQPPNWWDWPDR